MEEAGGMAPRVLVVQRPLEVDGIEWAIARDGNDALDQAEREFFDTVVVDLRLDVLDGWFVLAALGTWSHRPRLVAVVGEGAEAARAHALGADLCVRAGTTLHVRLLDSAWQRSRVNSCPRPTTSGASA
jgi:CheY-like chemotaxis protein